MTEDRRIALPPEIAAPTSLVEQRFIPQRYEPNYAYPLLVLFHGRGSDEHQLIRSVPTMSWRNYVALGLRGPEAIWRNGEILGYGWGAAFRRGERRPAVPRGHSGESAIEVVQRVLQGGSRDSLDVIEEGAFGAVRELRRTLHVHSERIFLVGLGEGAAVAYQLALSYPESFAGVVAMNGWLPRTSPILARCHACRDLGLKILMVHGEWNGRVPIERARRDAALLRAAGLSVAFQSYPCSNRLSSPMLSDVDTWLIHQCTRGI